MTAAAPKSMPDGAARDEAAKVREALKETRTYCTIKEFMTVAAAAERWADYLDPMVCKTREVMRWHVEYADDCGDARVDGAYRTVEDAERAKGWRLKEGCQCVRVTGPHAHQVPA